MQKVKQWLSDVWVKSWTTALGWAKVWAGVGMAAGSYLGHVVNDAGVQSALSRLTLPAELGLGLAVLGAIVLISEAHNVNA